MLKKLDIFEYNPIISVEGNHGFKTNLGGIFSIFIAALSILALGAFGKDMVLRTNPT